MSKLRMIARTSLALAVMGTLRLLVAGGGELSTDLRLPSIAAPVAAAQPALARQAAVATGASTTSKRSQRVRERGEQNRGEAAEARERAFEERERKYGPRPDHPGEAIAFRRLSMIDEKGYIPPDGLIKAKQHADMMRAATRVRPTAGISRTTWTWKGPGNIGGRTRSIAINPVNPSTMFAGTVGGGIWKTINSGASWSAVDDFMANLAVTSILYQPGSATVMYAGTGEGFWNGDAIRGAGIFKSVDGGTTWTQLSSTANANFYYVNRLAISADGAIVLAATRSGLFKSLDGGANFTFSGTAPASGATDVKFLPGSSTLAVASGYNGTAYFSSNGGTSWSASSLALGGTFTRVELAVSPSAPANVYAMVDVSNGTLYKSTNYGVSYGPVSVPGHLNRQGWYDNVIWVDPTNDNNLVIGGLDLHRSTNGGGTFTRISNWQYAPTSSAHADQHAIVSDPGYNGTTNKRVYFGNDGGVYKAEDVSTVTNASSNNGWTSLNNSFGPTQFYGAAGSPSTGRITGGTQDNGDLFLASGAGTSSWVDRFGGDGGSSAYDPTDPNTFYGEYVYLTVHRNTTGGSGFSEDIWGSTDTRWVACKAAPYRIDDACNEIIGGFSGGANFIAPFVLDPNNPNTMLAGGSSLWRSTDMKTAAITSTTGPAWTNIFSVTSGTNYINAIAVAPGNSSLIYVGYNNGDVYMTTNGTAATPVWNKVDSAGMPNSQVQRIAIDPNNNNSVWVALGGYTTTNLWHSGNGASAAATWTLSTGSGGTALPAAPIRGIAIHPTISGYIYVGTEVGVFASTDGGATWGTQDGPANVSVDELSWMGTTLIAATHGRGVWTADTGGTATFPTQITIDVPASGATVTMPITVAGWAINRGATTGTGVDAVHVYITPAGGAAMFLGAATYGAARSDIGGLYGSQFTNSGYTFAGGSGVAAGAYTVSAYAHNTITGIFDAVASVNVTVGTRPGNAQIAVDTPTANQVVTSAFEIGGWLLDANASSGTGVDDVTFYVQLPTAAAPGVFIGHGRLGLSRPDVGALYGSQFNNAGFHFTITGLSPGPATLWVIGHSTVTGSDSISKAVPFTVSATGLMSIDVPTAESIISANAFSLGGWAIDKSVEGTLQAGTGVDSVVVYAYHNPGSGEPAVFLGVADYGVIERPDVAAFYGDRYKNSGYGFIVDRAAAGLGTGEYNIVPIAHSTITNKSDILAIVRVVLQ